MQSNQDWYVYILHCADNTLYTGITTDPERRLLEHNQHAGKSAKYTRVRRPVTLIYKERHPDRSSAARREYEIKQLTRSQKEALFK